MYRWGKALLIGAVVWFYLPLCPAPAELSTAECLECHQDPDLFPSAFDPAVLKKSVHGNFDCTDCHSDVLDAPHETTPQRVSCGSCHEDIASQAAGSFHQSMKGKDKDAVPSCTTCHGAAHEIFSAKEPAAKTSPANVAANCATCHADPAFIEKHKLDIPAPFLVQYAKLVHSAFPEHAGARTADPRFREGENAPASSMPPPPEEENCFMCHGDPDFKLYVDPAAYTNSIHSKNRCTSCHADAEGMPHPKKLAPVNCGACHRIETQIYLASDHGKAVASGISQAASCRSCHGEPHHLLNSRDPASPVHRANIPETCAACHDDPKLMARFRLVEPRPYHSYLMSIHGKAHKEGIESAAVCTDCHGSHDLHGTLNPESKIYKLNIPKTCGRCHENVLKTYQISIHGKAIEDGIMDAPACTDCHGEHEVQGPNGNDSPVSAAHVVETCSRCHSSTRIAARYGLPSDRVETYLSSYHGLARQAGSLVAANCASCHGFHDVLPSTDSRSSIYPANLSQTCGKCHPGAGPHLAEAKVHLTSVPGGQPIIDFVRKFYVWFIALVLGFMILHNFLDFLRKLLNEGNAGKKDEDSHEERLSLNERIQHFVLSFCFTGLGYTGLCHRYPQATWALPLMSLEGGTDIRRFLHRAFAVVFVLLGVYHVLWMIYSKYGRSVLKALRPKPSDFGEAVSLVGHNVGLKKDAPKWAGKFNYIEKMEYWALIWGTIIMTITGFFLTFENLTLRYFPKWVVDLALTVHFYEALLAILAIFIWHFYWTVFDPDVYPMSWAWLTGFRKRKSKREDKENNSQ